MDWTATKTALPNYEEEVLIILKKKIRNKQIVRIARRRYYKAGGREYWMWVTVPVGNRGYAPEEVSLWKRVELSGISG